MRQGLLKRHRPEREARPGLTRRLLWFVALWAASVAALGAVGLAIRAVLA